MGTNESRSPVAVVNDQTVRLLDGVGVLSTGIINRMILGQLIKVFLISLVALTGLFLVAGLVQEATQRGLSPEQLLKAIPYIIPNSLPYTIPATTLFATCVVYGRLSADNEVLVLRTVGVNIYQLLLPALVLGLLTAGVTGALYYDTIPRSQRQLRELLLDDAEGVIHRLIKNEGSLKQGSLDFALYVREVQGRDLLDVVVKKRKADRSGYELIATARTARLTVEYRPPVSPGAGLVAAESASAASGSGTNDSTPNVTPFWSNRGSYAIVVRMNHCFVISQGGQDASEVECLEISTPVPDAIFGKNTKGRPSGQTWNELFEYRAEVIQNEADLRRKAEYVESRARSASGAEARALREESLQIREGHLKYAARLLRGMNTEIQMRPALALSCLCFALVGCPVGIRASRADYLSVFIICFLPTVFIYYPILIGTLKMSNDGTVPPAATWAANGVAFIAAGILIRWLMKR
jgi:lipopolysaccharide export system permease protein